MRVLHECEDILGKQPFYDAAAYFRELSVCHVLCVRERGVVFFSVRRDGIAVIKHLAVGKKNRRKGVGRMLVMAVAERGRSGVELVTTDSGAVAFYESCGFVKAGMRCKKQIMYRQRRTA